MGPDIAAVRADKFQVHLRKSAQQITHSNNSEMNPTNIYEVLTLARQCAKPCIQQARALKKTYTLPGLLKQGT